MLFSLKVLFLTAFVLTFKQMSAIPVISEVLKVYKLSDKIDNMGSGSEQEILDRLIQITTTLRKIDNTLTSVKSSAEWIGTYSSVTKQLGPHLNKVNDIRNEIRKRANRRNMILKNYQHSKADDLIKFADLVSQGDESVHSLLDRLDKSSNEVQFRNGNIPTSINSFNITASVQQYVYIFYYELLLTELEGFLLEQFAAKIYKDRKHGIDDRAIITTQNGFNTRGTHILKSLVENLQDLDLSIWKSDPDMHIEGDTYDEVTRLTQGFFINEIDLDYVYACNPDCSTYTEVTQMDSRDCVDPTCAKQPSQCKGTLRNCQQQTSTVCLSDDNKLRYEEKGEYCTILKPIDYTHRSSLSSCDTCLCICDEKGPYSDRFFDLSDVVSNVTANKVVTGLRLRKINRVFHLEIQQGQINVFGNINKVEWVPVDKYEISSKRKISGIHYHTMTWQNRSMVLDDIHAKDPESLITGVRFKVGDYHENGSNEYRSFLYLEMRTTKFDYITGKLDTGSSRWEANGPDYIGERKTTLTMSKKPTATQKSTRISRNHMVEFSHSDRKEDFAQFTIPFIDIQPVVSSPPVPLSGVGIYYKTDEYNQGGYIGPVLYTYDFASYFKRKFQM